LQFAVANGRQTEAQCAMTEGFADKLALVLKALSISHGRLAADVGVDKSLVGRWCSGKIQPSAHNCARLTHKLAARLPELAPPFSMIDWDLDLATLADRLGVVIAPPPKVASDLPSGFAEWLKLGKLREAALASGKASAALAGLWRTTRAAPELPGRFAHDYVIMQTTDDGPLSFRMGIFSHRMIGWAIPVGDQMYCCCTNQSTGGSVFAILNRVHRARIEVLDGVSLACMNDAGGTPVAAAILLERIADLSGDPDADEARYEELLAEHPVAPDDSIPEDVKNYLLFDTGPTALANGGDGMIMIRALTSRACGSNRSPGIA
jgi:transcriptional regulator with XRE-family HTH domain